MEFAIIILLVAEGAFDFGLAAIMGAGNMQFPMVISLITKNVIDFAIGANSGTGERIIARERVRSDVGILTLRLNWAVDLHVTIGCLRRLIFLRAVELIHTCD